MKEINLGLFLETNLVILWVLGKEQCSAVSCALSREAPQVRGICGLDLDVGDFFLILKLITLVFIEINQAFLQALKYLVF